MTKSILQMSFIVLSAIALSACSANQNLAADNNQTVIYTEQTESIQNDQGEVSTTIELLKIKHHMVECEGTYVGHCMLTQKEGDAEWNYFYDTIEGFDYEWGSDYEILVEVQDINLGLADTSLKLYTLIEVLDQTSVSTEEQFSYTSLNMHERIVEIAFNRFSLLGGKEFTCVEEECGSVRAAIAQQQSALLSFSHSEDAATPLMLEAVLCSDARGSFLAACL